jgi:hypothetical protein
MGSVHFWQNARVVIKRSYEKSGEKEVDIEEA